MEILELHNKCRIWDKKVNNRRAQINAGVPMKNLVPV